MAAIIQGEHIHFSRDEFAARRGQAVAELQRRGLGALLMFRQESMYWLTGYDTFGYVFFQCLVLTDDGRFALLTRAPDLLQARFTSIVDQVRVWIVRGEAGERGGEAMAVAGGEAVGFPLDAELFPAAAELLEEVAQFGGGRGVGAVAMTPPN